MARLHRKNLEIDQDELEVVLRYGDARYALGDMYEDLRTIEVEMHRLLRSSLEQEYGPGETGWWQIGMISSKRLHTPYKITKTNSWQC
jgi:hypothetical protein